MVVVVVAVVAVVVVVVAALALAVAIGCGCGSNSRTTTATATYPTYDSDDAYSSVPSYLHGGSPDRTRGMSFLPRAGSGIPAAWSSSAQAKLVGISASELRHGWWVTRGRDGVSLSFSDSAAAASKGFHYCTVKTTIQDTAAMQTSPRISDRQKASHRLVLGRSRCFR